MPIQNKSVRSRGLKKKRIWLVAKGPSCLKAQEYVTADDGLASVNDGAMHVKDKAIDFVFFSEIAAIDRVKPQESRINRFVSRQPLDWQLNDYPDWMLDRWTFYSHRECAGDRASITKRIIEGGICHHHTTPGAIHYLCKFENYDEVCVLGADGGKEYAKGKESLGPPVVDLSEWAIITRRIADVCSKVYDTQVRFYS